jgi:hypothetical protein
MPAPIVARRMLAHEAHAMLTRLGRVRPFALYEPMVPAAALSPAAQTAIEKCLAEGRRDLRRRVNDYLRWVDGEGSNATAEELQRRFTMLRLTFNNVLSQFDLFSDAITQRSEHDTGVWLSGLDVVSADALSLPESYYDAPPVVCYLDRGPGAAIRRARTRLPGDVENPVAIIQVPRERMVGTGIASSLVHEVGHQGAALLELVESIRPLLQQRWNGTEKGKSPWWFWDRWISEILADFWSVGKIGIGSTLGLMAVVSLPAAFVFRLNVDDPHPTPWIRVKLSAAIGSMLYPHPQWSGVAKLWELYYPLDGIDEERRKIFAMLEESMPEFVELIANHRPGSLRGRSLAEVMPLEERTPERLAGYYQQWGGSVMKMRSAPPTLAFAVLGQARADAKLLPEEESEYISYLLKYWALRSTLDTSAKCATAPPPRLSKEVRTPEQHQIMSAYNGG